MKKDKLYTANRWNQPAFMVDRQRHNIFDGFGTSQMNSSNPFGVSLNAPTLTPYVNWSNHVQRAQALGNTKFMANNFANQAASITGAFSNQQAANLAPKENAVSNPWSFKDAFSKQGIKDGLKAGAGAAIGAAGSLIGSIGGGLIGGGLESGAGSAISGIGSTVGSAVSAVNPILGGVISAGSGLVGGLVNRAFGTKVDQAKLNAANEGTDKLRNFTSTATSFDDIQGPAAMAKVLNPYSGGWFSSGKARRKNEELKRQRQEAKEWAERGVVNNIDNLVKSQMDDAIANYSAFGGPLFMDSGSDMGAINYGFMSDYLTQKKREAEAKNKMSGITPVPSLMSGFAFGGDLQTNGADFPTGLMHIDAGQSHELNPYEGVQLGVDPEGVPNLVEENETVWNDYVFSARIPIDQTTKELFHISKKREMTYADLSKKLEKEISERVNDPISRAGFEKQMAMLEEQQERQKKEMEAAKAKAAFEALTPEEQTAVMNSAAQQAQQQAMAEQAQMQQPSPEEVAMAQQQSMMQDGSEAALGQEPQMMAAEGGKFYAPGGYLWDKFWSPVNEYSKKKGNTKGKYQIDKTYKDDVKALEESDAYKAFTDYILNNASDEERMKYFQWIDANTGRDNKYITDGKLADNWKDMYQAARTDGLYGIQHYTPEFDPTLGTPAPEAVAAPEPRVFHAMVDDEDYIQGELDPNVVGAEVRRTTLPNGDTVIYHDYAKAPEAAAETPAEGEKGVAPRHRAEWMRYAGLFGPAVGLGLQMAGVGRPDTGAIDAAIQGAGDVTPASWKPLGNYLTYRPLDIWYANNRAKANARATDRNIMNTSGGNRGTAMAGLLANGYNSQLASGELFRQAQEYNDALKEKTARFNRETDQYNSEQFGQTSRFNADAYNQARRANAQLRLHAAQQKSAMDADWYNGIYGNITGLFKGLGDLGTENYRMNRVSEMAADGIFGNLGESYTGKKQVKKKCKGGKVNKKRGLTF